MKPRRAPPPLGTLDQTLKRSAGRHANNELLKAVQAAARRGAARRKAKP